jgi:trimeric autotransporter adhesin
MSQNIYPAPGSNVIKASSFATSTGTIVLSGSNITISTGASSIQIIGPTIPSATNFSLNGTSSSVSLVAGANIAFASAASIITISASNSGTVQSAIIIGTSGNTAGVSSSITSGGVTFVGGNNITLSQSLQAITISGPAVPAATNFSLNASSSFVSLVAGANIAFASGANSITISASNSAAVQSVIVIGTSGNTAGVSSSISTGSVTFVGGNNITLSQSLQAITIVGPNTLAAATNTIAGGGTTVTGTAVNLNFSAGPFISLQSASAAGALTLTVSGSNQSILHTIASIAGGSSSGTANTASSTAFGLVAGSNITLSQLSNSPNITISANVPASASVVSSLNGFTGAVSISAGAGIGIGQAANTITISASNQTSSLSYVAAFGTGAATSTGTIILAAGANIGLATAANTISISASNQTSSLSYVASLNGSSGALSISAGANIGTGQAGSVITISASNQSALVSMGAVTAGGATSGAANTVSSTAFAFVAGSNITLSQSATSPQITIIGPSPSGGGGNVVQGSNLATSTGTIVISGGNNIKVSTGVSSIQIGDLLMSKQSMAWNYPIQQVDGAIVSKTGTVNGVGGFGSSLFLQRMTLTAAMAMTEVDLAMAINFPATNQGAGTMSQTFVVYSFGNSTSLASVASASGTSAWQTGTSTTAGAASLTQFQGGWSGPLIHPMTFASTSLPAGEYVVGNIFDLSQVSSSWSVSLYGDQGLVSSVITAFTAAPTAASALSSGGLLAGSVHTASSSSSLTAWSAAPTNMAAISSSGLSAVTGITSFVNTGISNATVFGMTHASAAVSSFASASSTAVTAATWAAIPWISGTAARTNFTGVTSGSALLNAGTAAFAGFLGSGGLLAGSFLTASGSVNAISNSGTAAATVMSGGNLTFGYIGTGATSINPTAFVAGIMSTGGAPTSLNLATITALSFSGSAIFAQPWFQIVGS